MPNVLLRKGLFVAIVEFAEDINKTKGLRINVQNSANNLNLSSVKEIHLYRIIQETINNSIKHAKATVFNINIFVVNENLQIELSDNGKGFDYRLVLKEGTGSGLRNILSRVEILNGEMFLDTKPGAGVIYTISVPLKADK
jgi:signal transduction histidine kinase